MPEIRSIHVLKKSQTRIPPMTGSALLRMWNSLFINELEFDLELKIERNFQDGAPDQTLSTGGFENCKYHQF